MWQKFERKEDLSKISLLGPFGQIYNGADGSYSKMVDLKLSTSSLSVAVKSFCSQGSKYSKS